MTLVEIDPAEQRMVEVRIPVTHRDGAVEEAHSVPERFVNEPRCRDTAACRERVAALALSAPAVPEPMQTAPQPTADVGEPDADLGPSWMRS